MFPHCARMFIHMGLDSNISFQGVGNLKAEILLYITDAKICNQVTDVSTRSLNSLLSQIVNLVLCVCVCVRACVCVCVWGGRPHTRMLKEQLLIRIRCLFFTSMGHSRPPHRSQGPRDPHAIINGQHLHHQQVICAQGSSMLLNSADYPCVTIVYHILMEFQFLHNVPSL